MLLSVECLTAIGILRTPRACKWVPMYHLGRNLDNVAYQMRTQYLLRLISNIEHTHTPCDTRADGWFDRENVHM
jgi:hypothetical protein